ncbi:MAG: LD-carboxypeptidase, partial [Lentisphaeria bacterium]
MPPSTPACPRPFPAAFRRLGLAAPARPAAPDRLAAGRRQLEAWGLEAVTAGGDQRPARYFSAADAPRADAFNALLRAPRLDALWAVRGGYGCARLLERVDWPSWQRNPLPLIGYSDISILHLAAFGRGIRSGLAGPMLAVEFGQAPATPAAAAALAFTGRSLAAAWQPQPRVALPDGVRLAVLKSGTAAGPVVPANLALLVSLLGTPWLPDLTGCLLVVEDVNEAAYRIDRNLNQLRQAGVLQRLAGLVFADFAQVEDGEWLPEILAETAALIPGPVAAGLPHGHCLPLVTVPVGRPATLDATTGGGVT